MGCNMCVVDRPEEQYRIMFQKGNTLRPIDGEIKLKGRRTSHLLQDKDGQPHDPLLLQVVRKGRRRVGTAGGAARVMAITDCMDNGTQTDISFQNLLGLGGVPYPSGASSLPPPSPPLPPLVEPYLLNDLCSMEFNDPNDYFDIAHHEVDRQEELEYEEVELYKSSQQDKLGLTVCYRTEDEDDLGIYVGEVNPNSIAAKDGRIRLGDRILQINGVDIQDREEAVAILTREDSTNISLLLARPEIETDPHGDTEDLECELPEGMVVDHLPSLCRLRQRVQAGGGEEPPVPPPREIPALGLAAALSNSQELDSGVGRTDESTRNEESSEHDLLADDQTSASNTNATNTPGSLRKFRPGRADTPPLLHLRELQLSSDSLPGLEMPAGAGRYLHDPVVIMMMPGLTEEECERYRQLLEIKCQYEKNCNAQGGERERGQGGEGEEEEEGEEGGAEEGERAALDVNCNESLSQHEMALIEEELRHLEFKCRNILRAQKMQQLRERCLKAWLLEEEAEGRKSTEHQASPHELSDINELPERERSDKDSTSAYNTGGESCRSTPLVSENLPPLSTQMEESVCPLPGRVRDRPSWSERGRPNLNCSFSPNTYRKLQAGVDANAGQRFGSLSRDGSMRSEAGRRGPRTHAIHDRGGGRSAESSPYFTRRRHSNRPPERYRSCVQLGAAVPEIPRPLERSADGQSEAAAGSDQESPIRLGHPTPLSPILHPSPAKLSLALPLPPASPRMEWKVKIRSDGTRYVAKRPVRDRLLKARAMKIREERSGMTTDDDAVSEMKMGRYWSKEERKQQLLRAREQRRRREFMMQSRLDYLRGAPGSERDLGPGALQEPLPQGSASILELSQKKSMKKRNRRILDNWITIQELLAHGSRSPDGKKVYNPLLSVTTV